MTPLPNLSQGDSFELYAISWKTMTGTKTREFLTFTELELFRVNLLAGRAVHENVENIRCFFRTDTVIDHLFQAGPPLSEA